MSENYFQSLPEDIRSKFSVGDTVIYVPALEYANFIVTNGVVLVSGYWKEGMPATEKLKDQKIQKILKEFYPNRDIIPLDVLPINWGGGGIHCRTQQQPKTN
jgi:agmatine deiminase